MVPLTRASRCLLLVVALLACVGASGQGGHLMARLAVATATGQPVHVNTADRAVGARAVLTDCVVNQVCINFQGAIASNTLNLYVINRYTFTTSAWAGTNGAWNLTIKARSDANLRRVAATGTWAVHIVMPPLTVYNYVVNLTKPSSGPYASPQPSDLFGNAYNYNQTGCWKPYGASWCWSVIIANWTHSHYINFVQKQKQWFYIGIHPETTLPNALAYDNTGTLIDGLTMTLIAPNGTHGLYKMGYYTPSTFTGDPYTGDLYINWAGNSTNRLYKITHNVLTSPLVIPTDIWIGDCFYLYAYPTHAPVSINNTFIYRPTAKEGAGRLGSTPPSFSFPWSATTEIQWNAGDTSQFAFANDGYQRSFLIEALAAGNTTLILTTQTNVPGEFVTLNTTVANFMIHDYGVVSWVSMPATAEVYTPFTVTASASLGVVGSTKSLVVTPICTGATASFSPSSCVLSGATTTCAFQITISSAGAYNMSFILSGLALAQYYPPTFSLGTATLTPGNVTAAGPAFVYIGTPRTLVVNVTRLPVVGQSLTVTPMAVSGPGTAVFTPSSFTFNTSTPSTFTFQLAATGAGAFTYKVVSSGNALSTYTIKNVTGLSTTLTATTTLVISIAPTLVKNTDYSFNVTLPVAPRAGTGLFVTPSAPGAIFTPTSLSTTAATLLAFTVTVVSTGPVTFSLGVSGTATEQYNIPTQAANVIDAPGDLTINALSDTPTVWLGTPRSIVVSASPSSGYQLTITPSIQAGNTGVVTFNPPVLSYGMGVLSRTLTLTGTTLGPLTIAFALGGNASSLFITPPGMTITVASQDAQTFSAPGSVPPLTSASFPITLSAAPLGQAVTVTPTVTVNSGTPSVLGGVVFNVGDSVLTKSFSYTPQAVGSMSISLAVTNPYGQYTTQTSGSTTIVFSPKGDISCDLPASVCVNQAYDVTVTLSMAPVAAIKVDVLLPGATITSNSTSSNGRLDFAAGFTTAMCRVVFTTAGNVSLSLDPIGDVLAQYNQPPNRIVSVIGIATVPGVPQDVEYMFDDTHLNITWDAPATDGGAVIESYLFTIYSDSGQNNIVQTLPAFDYERSVVAKGLTPSTTYYFSGVAINAVGSSARTSRSQFTTSAGPGQPTTQQPTTITSTVSPTTLGTVESTSPDMSTSSTTATSSSSASATAPASSTSSTTADSTTSGSDNNPQTPDAIIQAPAPPASDSNAPVFAAIGAAFGVLLAVLIVFLVVSNRRKARAARERLASDNGATVQLDLTQSQGTRRYVEKLLGQRSTSSIGRGGTAEVYKAKDEDGEYVAIKRLTQKHAKAMAEFHQEVTIISQLGGRNHPNVIGLKCFCDEPPCIVMELAEAGSLYDLLKTSNKLKSDKQVTYIFEVAAGMQFLHSCWIAHLDIKPRNVLIGKGGVLKITDFGVSAPTNIPYTTSEFAGTPAYAPPERFRVNTTIDLTKSDVYSYGLTMLALLTGKEPYAGQSIETIVAKHSAAAARSADASTEAGSTGALASYDPEFAFPTTVPDRLRMLLQSSVATAPENRPSFVELVNGVRACEWAEGVELDGREGETIVVPIRSNSLFAAHGSIPSSSPASSPLNSVNNSGSNLNTMNSAAPTDLATSLSHTIENPVFAATQRRESQPVGEFNSQLMTGGFQPSDNNVTVGSVNNGSSADLVTMETMLDSSAGPLIPPSNLETTRSTA